jgi:predicted amidophosphoribosyltransferase
LRRLEAERYAACDQCAAVLSAPAARCGACLARSHYPLRGTLSLFRYHGLGREVIWRLKRDQDGVIAQGLAEAWRIRDHQTAGGSSLSAVEVIVCIPQRLRFPWEAKNAGPTNLSQALATMLGIPAMPGALRTRKWLRKQHELSVRQRQVNVRRAFRVHAPADINNRAVLLVDDVMTSGATLCSAAEALLHGGAREVWGAVAARGQAFGATHPYAAKQNSSTKNANSTP